jgi:hypothetical protein
LEANKDVFSSWIKHGKEPKKGLGPLQNKTRGKPREEKNCLYPRFK